ncbi:hypothetical protein EAF04_006651 [Stromatinia cepivora]|nr:hypothetical protein EAF04_006651 [Stromatinia cepivora]
MPPAQVDAFLSGICIHTQIAIIDTAQLPGLAMALRVVCWDLQCTAAFNARLLITIMRKLIVGSQSQKMNPKHSSPLSMPNSTSQVQLFVILIFLPNSISSASVALSNPPVVYGPDLFAYFLPG